MIKVFIITLPELLRGNINKEFEQKSNDPEELSVLSYLEWELKVWLFQFFRELFSAVPEISLGSMQKRMLTTFPQCKFLTRIP